MPVASDFPFGYGDRVAVREEPTGTWFAGTIEAMGTSGLTITHYADPGLKLYAPWGATLVRSVPDHEWDAMVADETERQARIRGER